jgi:hypothetical protein
VRLLHILADFSHSSLVSHRFGKPRFAEYPEPLSSLKKSQPEVRTGPETVVLLTAQGSPPDTYWNHNETALELQIRHESPLGQPPITSQSTPN